MKTILKLNNPDNFIRRNSKVGTSVRKFFCLVLLASLFTPMAMAKQGPAKEPTPGKDIQKEKFDIRKAAQQDCFEQLPMMPYKRNESLLQEPVDTYHDQEALVALYAPDGTTAFSKVRIESSMDAIVTVKADDKIAPGIYLVMGSDDHCILPTQTKVKIN